jgi:uncharacterized protein with PIN domain
MKIKTWGEPWYEEMSRSRDNRCPECHEGTLGRPSIENVAKLLVGIDTRGGSFKVTAIFRCPKCENLFWFHLDLIFAEWVLEDMEDR